MKSINTKIILDSKDQYLLKEHSWFNCRGRIRIKIKNKQFFLHHLILPPKEGFVIDHINRNRLDNRRCNLRYVTHSQSQMNRSKQKNNTSGFRGVYWNKHAKKWVSIIGIKGKLIHLGYYINIEEAAKAYKNKAMELFGEYMGEL
ncbi:MAG: HNH endonuclease [Candidatus Marinimicrobia bacterium]|nr:HNH endonuclease [Candidatus Neomarinimicrobiota bacterium]